MANGLTKHRFVSFPELSSPELVLRRVMLGDVPSIRDISFYDGVAAATEEDAVAILERIEEDYKQGNSVHWGICLRGSDEVAGTCGFYRGYPANVGEIGYVLRAAYRGQGVMTKALRLVLQFGFAKMTLSEIVAFTAPTNWASIGVLERLGFAEAPFGPDGLEFVLPKALAHNDLSF